MGRRILLVGMAATAGVLAARAGDWPQWRGPNRDAHVTGFTAPATWPKELTKKWSVTVGDGVATPALVGDRLYVFAREGGDEVIRCLDAATGKEVWQDKYPAKPATGPAGQFPGPRASPAVAQGKVVTYGVQGTLSCLDAGTGKVVWRKDGSGLRPPMFFTSSSPEVVDGLCVVQLGGDSGAVAAFDLTTGDERWRWAGDGTKYSSPSVLTADGTTMVVAVTAGRLVGLGAADGKLLWQVPLGGGGGGGGKGGGKGGKGGRAYNAGSPVVDGQTVITSGTGRGVTAYRIEKTGDKWAAAEVWSNKGVSAEFNTPVVHDGLVFGLSDRNALFCLDAKTGKTAWTADTRGGGRLVGYGSIVDAGSVLLALTPAGRLIVFAPTAKEFKEVAGYPVAAGDTYAYPVADRGQVYVKDKTAVTMWTVE